MRKAFVLLLRFWQGVISPLYPPSCRYHPTCSEYAILAVEKYGVLKGML
ncbi:MAG: membrane protein insertion efficiency factor YidD, partial [Hydrogenobacter sp.]